MGLILERLKYYKYNNSKMVFQVILPCHGQEVPIGQICNLEHTLGIYPTKNFVSPNLDIHLPPPLLPSSYSTALLLFGMPTSIDRICMEDITFLNFSKLV